MKINHETRIKSNGDADWFVEPLKELSRFAFDWADHLCDAEHGCTSYHKMWSLVRLVEAEGALPAGQQFFDRELPHVARGGHATVLLSGAADTGLMTLAVQALAKAQIECSVIMADRCATPLEQARLYAAAKGINLTTRQGMLHEIDAPQVDVILAHSFLTFIPAPDRLGLFQSWARFLRSGGKVLMSQRIAPEDDPYVRKRPQKQIGDRREQLSAKLALNNPIGYDVEALLDAAEGLWTNAMGGQSVSAAEIGSLCAAVGLEIESIAYHDEKTSVSPFALAKQATSRPRAEIVLRRL